MVNQQAQYILKLRQNITLDGDLLLAKLELEAFFRNTVREVANIEALMQQIPALGNLRGFSQLDLHVREKGVQAYVSKGPLAVLSGLIRCVSFIQRIYCVTKKTVEAQRLLAEIEGTLGPVVIHRVDGELLIIEAIPHYALFEFSQVVVMQSNGIVETKRNLSAVLDALLGRTNDQHAQRLAEKALSARSTTSHLSHDIHYYKAKFFPRLARSVLNIYTRRCGGRSHRVVDNFVGSGTTLLEAATLGIPSVGIDIDPLSVLITKAKLEAVQVDSELLAKESTRVLQALERQAHEDVPAIRFPSWLMKNRRMTFQIANELSKEIGVIQSAIAGSEPQVITIFRALMSDAISRKIRMRFLGTGVGRFSLTFAKKSIVQIFSRSLVKYVKVAATSEWLRQVLHLRFAAARVIQGDARRLPSELGKFDILMTSPPYLPASSGRESYAKAHAPSLIALGMATYKDVDNLVYNSIGSMNGDGVDVEKLSKRERDIVEWLRRDELRAIKAKPTARYFLDMRRAFLEMRRVLLPGAYCIVISGKQSTFYQFSTRKPLYTVHSALILAEEAQQAGFEVEALHDVQLVKLNRNARPRSLDDYYETIIVLRNRG